MTYREAYIKAKELLRNNAVDNYAFDAFCIFEHCFNISRRDFTLHYYCEVPENLCNIFFKFVEKRIDYVPLQYILGYWNFMERKYFVGEGVLIPRSDTEVLVKKSVDFLRKIDTRKEKIKILDLCSGTGIVAISLAKTFKNSEVLAVELYDESLKYLKKNIEYNEADNVEILRWNVLSGVLPRIIENDFDLIVSNPPYIKTSEIDSLQEEVKKEPIVALDGGRDGLDFYKKILENWKLFLKKGGAMCVEIGFNQFSDVAKLFKENGFKDIEVIKDYNDLDRVVFGIA